MPIVEPRALEEDEVTDDMIAGATIFGPDGETIGFVARVDGSGTTGSVLIEVGGFLGIGSKSIIVPLIDLSFMRGANDSTYAVTSWTKAELKQMPAHDA